MTCSRQLTATLKSRFLRCEARLETSPGGFFFCFRVSNKTSKYPATYITYIKNGTSLTRRGGLLKFELHCAFCALDSRVIGANMGCKLFVALQLEVSHHFIERFTRGRGRRIKPPGAIRASKTAKTVFFDPYKRAWHLPVKFGF